MVKLSEALHDVQQRKLRWAAESTTARTRLRTLDSANVTLTHRLHSATLARLQQEQQAQALGQDLVAALRTQPPKAGHPKASARVPALESHNPCVERAVQRVLCCASLRAKDKQLELLMCQLVEVQAQVELQRARADDCEAADVLAAGAGQGVEGPVDAGEVQLAASN